MKLKDVFDGYYDKVPDGMMGLELEVEGKSKLPQINTGTWNTTTDQSLRGAAPYEYVTRSPLPLQGIPKALEYLLGKLNDPTQGDPDTTSTRTSWHVHLNALHYTPVEMMTRVFTYWMVEPLIIKHCGKHREQNTFALQLKDSGHLLKVFNESFFINMVSKPTNVVAGNNHMSTNRRYGAQNITALCKYGSIEYRAMNGTLALEEIKLWTAMLATMWTENKFSTPTELFNTYYDDGASSLVEKVFHNLPEMDEFMKKHMNQEVKDDIEENVLMLLGIEEDMPYTWEDWERRIKKAIYERGAKPKLTSSKLDMYEQQLLAQMRRNPVRVEPFTFNTINGTTTYVT